MDARALLVLLLAAGWAGCAEPAPDAAPEPPRIDEDAITISWSPEAPRPGETVRFEASPADLPAQASLQWTIAGRSLTGRHVLASLPEGDHEVTLNVSTATGHALLRATVPVRPEPVATPPAPEPKPPAEPDLEPETDPQPPDPGTPAISLHQEVNVVRVSVDWGARPDRVRWYFGDGAQASTEEARHAYGATGTFTVTLVAHYLGTLHEVQQDVVVAAVPLSIDWTIDGDTVMFDHAWGRTATSWSWAFGDGQTSTTAAPVHTFASPGPWTVTLSAGDGAGTESTQADLTFTTWPLEVAVVQDLNAVNLTFSWGWEPTSVHWDLGDGTTSQALAVDHAFDDPGTHQAVLEVTDGAHSARRTFAIDVERVPLRIEHTVQQATVDFGFVWGPSTDTIAWDFDNDGSVDSSDAAPRHTFPSVGVHPVTLAVRAGGLAKSVTVDVHIADHPLAILAAPVVVDGVSYQSVDFDHDWGGITPTSIAWDFGDGTADASPVRHDFATPGTHRVTLEVRNETLSAQATLDVVVNAHSPYIVRCSDEAHVVDAPTHGTTDAIADLSWAALKTGFRVVVAWTSPLGEASSLAYRVDGTETTLTGDPSRTVQVFLIDDLPVGKGFCFTATQGSASHSSGMWLRNAMEAFDPVTGAYILNTLTIANEGASRAAIQSGYGIYAQKLWDASDGHIASGLDIVLFDDFDRNDGGRNACTLRGIPALLPDGPAACLHVFDVVFAHDAESPLVAGNTHLDGIKAAGAYIWMNQLHEARTDFGADNGPEVGHTLLHEMGHYAFGMQDMYTNASGALDCYDAETHTSIMGSDRAATEFDDATDRCPNEDALPDYEPSWTSLITRYPQIPDRPGAPLTGPEGGGPWSPARLFEVGQSGLCAIPCP